MVDKNFWKNRKVLITGHTGFKGSWLCLMLNYLGSKISGYALSPPTNPNLYSLCKIDSFVDSTIADIRDPGALTRKIADSEPEIIIHMAAQPLVRLSYSEPVLTYETNVMGTVNLFEAVRISECQSVGAILNVTTDKCYENREWIWPYRENEPLGGYDPYSSSKACSEIITAAYRSSFFNSNSKHKISIATARAGNVIGGGDWATDRLIPDIVRAVLNKQTVIIRSPDAIRPWQHVLEPLTGYLILCEHLFKKEYDVSGAFNFGPEENDSKPVSWIVERFCEKWPEKINYVIENDNKFHEANYLRLDNSKAKKVLGWRPLWHLEDSIDRIIEFMSAYTAESDINKLMVMQIESYLELSSKIL